MKVVYFAKKSNGLINIGFSSNIIGRLIPGVLVNGWPSKFHRTSPDNTQRWIDPEVDKAFRSAVDHAKVELSDAVDEALTDWSARPGPRGRGKMGKGREQ